MDKNRVIGYQNQLPWHLPADLKHFKALTMGKPMIMGRNTYDSLGKPLPGRQHIVITRRPLDAPAEVVVVDSLAKAFAAVADAPEVSIIGGQQIFQQALPYVQRIYLTRIDHEFVGDVFFPGIDEDNWKVISSESHLPDEKNAYSYTFLMMESLALSPLPPKGGEAKEGIEQQK